VKPTFTVLVEDTFTIPGRGTDIIGVLIEGGLPPVGTTVAVHAEGRPITYVLFSGIPMLPPQSPKRVNMLLRRRSKEDIPIGSHITNSPADAADRPLS
jgi:translation elongation factor EF-Tu-like GTPase